MEHIFKTFKPKTNLVKQYVDYYYLDLKPNNSTTEFICFPHFNNTISIYRSHNRSENGEVIFNKKSNPLQIFTPIRKNVLKVKQSGPVYRIVVVFHPLGVQQFYSNLNFSDYIFDFNFFTQTEIASLFSTVSIEELTNHLDAFLFKRFEGFNHNILEQCIHHIFNSYKSFSVEEFSNTIEISKRQLNRIFKTHIGISVKTFQKIVLFRKTINKKLFENPKDSFTKLAHEFHFNDQSHFNKTYKTLTTNSPKSFFSKGTTLGNEDTFWHINP
ncbi:MAG: helix-turn-helix domain-containing protein [Aestuariibaculum sp.]